MPRLSASVPTNHKLALDTLAHVRGGLTADGCTSSIIRETVKNSLAEQDSLPEEARDALDEDLLARQ